MTHPLSRILRTLLLCVPMVPPAMAEEAAPPDKPLLWKIEGGALEKPSYLFGTLHLTTPRIKKLHPAAERAFEASDTVATELPLDLMSQLAGSMLMMRKDGSTLSESIGAGLQAELRAAIEEINPALGPEIFEPMKTWAAAAAIVLLPWQLDGGKPLDDIIWQRAVKSGKEAVGLENAKDQAAAFEVLDEAGQIIYLRASLEKRAEQGRLLKNVVAAYEKGDDEAIRALMRDSMRDIGDDERQREVGNKLHKSLITDRDIAMAATIDTMLRNNPAKSRFIAVGAGHLVGDNSIRKHLEDKGWKITRITD